MAGFVLVLLRPRNSVDIRIGSSIQSLSLAGCSHWFSVHVSVELTVFGIISLY